MSKEIFSSILCVCALVISFNYSNASPTPMLPPEDVVNDGYVPAQFPGGAEGFEKWLKKNVHYPEEEEKMGIEETVTVVFTVTEDGDIKYPYVKEGENENLMEAALASMEKMPKWIPAKNNGEIVRAYHILPVNFNLL